MATNPILTIVSSLPSARPSRFGRHRYGRAAMRGRGNRYYAFRNLDRLKSLKRFRFLFGFFHVIAWLALAFGMAAFAVWFLFGLIFLMWFVPSWKVVLNYGVYAMIVGAAVIVLTLVLRILIERIYFVAERIELRKIPEGADKYIAVMRANTRVDIMQFVLWVIVAAAVVVGAVIGFGNNAVIVTIAAVTLAAIITGYVFSVRQYNRVADQIEEIKTERLNKKTAQVT